MYFLAAAILTNVWRLHEIVPVPSQLRLALLSLAGAIGAYFFVGGSGIRRMGNVKSPIVYMAAGLAAVMIAGVPFSLWPGRSFSFLLKDFLPSVLVLLVLLAASVRSEEDVVWYANVSVIGAALFALASLSGAGPGRVGGAAYYDANDMALVMVCMTPIGLFAFLRTDRRWLRMLIGLSVLLMVGAVVQSGSRGGFLGLCAVGLYVLFRYRSIAARYRIGTLVVALGLVLTVGSDEYFESLESLFTEPTGDYNWESDSGRKEVWQRGLGYMVTHPFLGVGARNFPQAEGTLSDQGQWNLQGGAGFKWSAAHNSFVQVGAETGIFGLLLFTGMIFAAFRTTLRAGPGRRRRGTDATMGQALAGSLIGYLVAGFFLSSAYLGILYLLLGMIVGLDKVERAKARRPVPRRSDRVGAGRRRRPAPAAARQAGVRAFRGR